MAVQLFDTEAYPAHLTDQTRLELATEILEKELTKQGWARHDASRSRSLLDFWDSFHAIMGTWLLKAGLVRMLTASNWRWEKQTVSVHEIQLTAFLEQLRQLPGVDKEALTIPKLTVLMQDPKVRAEQNRIVSSFSQDETQNTYRIVAVKKDGLYHVMDGNRRSLYAFLQGRPELDAWVAFTDDQPARDFWIPIDHMMQIVDESRRHPEQRSAYRQVVANWFAASKTARIAFDRRILGMKGAEALLPENLPKQP